MSGTRDTQGAPSVASLLDAGIKRQGLSLRELEERSGVPRSTLSRWRTGNVTNPYHEDMLLRVGAALDLSEVQVNQFLQAAGCRALREIRQAPRPEDEVPLRHWATATRHNLPAQLTSFVGREHDLFELTTLLDSQDPAMRLLTLVGPGGSGKSRLAIRTARDLLGSFPGGVFAVFLASINDPRLVIQSIAEAIGLRDVTDAALTIRLTGWLRTRRVLLLLDNLEQILDCGPEIVKLLFAAPELKVLATSREPLNVTGEHRWQVEPLPLPDPASGKRGLDQNPAIRLFTQRARAAGANWVFDDGHDDLATVAELCRRLDGLPLAIELAAAGIGERSPNHLLATAPNGLALASAGPSDLPARQQTLHATIRWSLDLLPPDVREILPCLAVFAGGWTEDAAAAVCGFESVSSIAPQLTRLTDANLIERLPGTTDGTPTRYRMLETIREYGLELLVESGEEIETRERHASYYLDLAESAPPYVPEVRENGWHERVHADIDNIRAALAWSEESENLELLSRLAVALWPYWFEYQLLTEGRRWLSSVLSRRDQLPLRRRADVSLAAANLITSIADSAWMGTNATDALEIYQRLDDPRGQALAYKQIGWAGVMRNQPESVFAAFFAELEQWRKSGDPLGIATGLSELAAALIIAGEFKAAEPYLHAEKEAYRDVADTQVIARTLRNHGLYALLTGDPLSAVPLFQEAVDTWRRSGSYLQGPTLFYLGTAQFLTDQLEGSIQSYADSLAIAEAHEDQVHLALLLLGFAAIAYRQGDPVRAAKLCGVSQRIRDDHQFALPPPVEQLYQREVGEVRNRIDTETFECAFADGQNLTTAEALAYAREVVPDPD